MLGPLAATSNAMVLVRADGLRQLLAIGTASSQEIAILALTSSHTNLISRASYIMYTPMMMWCTICAPMKIHIPHPISIVTWHTASARSPARPHILLAPRHRPTHPTSPPSPTASWSIRLGSSPCGSFAAVLR